MMALTYLLRLREPLLATQTMSGESNSATSANYVPGSMMRGAVLARLFSGQVLDPADQHRAYFDGTVRFLNAYPAQVTRSGEVMRLLPAPLSWQIDKYPTADTANRVFDLAIGQANLIRPKRFTADGAAYFVNPVFSNGQVEYREANQQIIAHNASSDRNEKRAGKSQVFRYEALAAGEMLAGVILGPQKTLEAIKTALAGQSLLLGGARTGGYGLVEVEHMVAHQEWREAEQSPAITNGTAVVTLLSDVVLRLPHGGFAHSLDHWVGQKATSAFVEMKVAGGFNRKWGLPLPQVWTMKAGSVFVYQNLSNSQQATLLNLINTGIGERQVDGYGRATLNWQVAPTLKRTIAKDELPLVDELTAEARAIAQRMANRQWRAQLESDLVAKIIDLPCTGSVPNPAQLARVRLAARQALFSATLTPVLEHLASLFDEKTQRPKRGAQQLLEASIENRTLIAWLRERAEQPVLNYFARSDRPQVAGIAAEDEPHLGVEFTARLIDGVMKQAIQKKKAVQAHTGGSHE